MRTLELLAPAKNADIGIAALGCGADAVYIAGPCFGARQAAGNSVEDIARLCSYAHLYGCRIFVAINTILYEDELPKAKELIRESIDAGADALIVQDFAILTIAQELFSEGVRKVPLHASTQSAILSPSKASMLESLGYSRLILERELSLGQIKAISDAAPECEIECFVHGALCVCYSGQCYLSENIAGRSANRGACIQACRSRYDLVDESGKVLVKDKALLSLKDLNLRARIGDLAAAGVGSFKIEGRLKNESYVKNVVREYSLALDALIAEHPTEYCRASFGKVSGAFSPNSDKTFNRAYTELYIDASRGKWAAMDAAKGMGENIGKVVSVKRDLRRGESILEVESKSELHNGDGFSFVDGKGEVVGFRGEVCKGLRGGLFRIEGRECGNIYKGAILYRNYDHEFEKELAAHPGTRLIDIKLSVRVQFGMLSVSALREDGATLEEEYSLEDFEQALNRQRMEALIKTQLGKTAGRYSFDVENLEYDLLPLLPSAWLNEVRRSLARKLEDIPLKARELRQREISLPLSARPLKTPAPKEGEKKADYKANISNSLAENIYQSQGYKIEGRAYELEHPLGAELMRTRYCIRYELGLCPRQSGHPDPRHLFLLNQGRRFALEFDCFRCEMVVRG